MSNILKTSGYQINYRNGVAGDFEDYIFIHRELAPEPLEDPTSTKWLVSFWIKDYLPSNLGVTEKLIFNWGNRFFCYIRPKSTSMFRVVFGFWKFHDPSGKYSFESWETEVMDASDKWEFWSFLVYDPYDAGEEGVDFYRNSVKEVLSFTAGVGIRVKAGPEPFWTFSADRETWDTDTSESPPLERLPLSCFITDLSIFVKEGLDYETIIEFLWNNGKGIDATEYDTGLDGSRLEVYLPLSDGWHLTRAPWKKRKYYDADGLLATCVFSTTQNTSKRFYDYPGGGRRGVGELAQYLAHTRSNNKFVQRNVPEFDHQNAWIGKSVPVTDFPDAEGM